MGIWLVWGLPSCGHELAHVAGQASQSTTSIGPLGDCAAGHPEILCEHAHGLGHRCVVELAGQIPPSPGVGRGLGHCHPQEREICGVPLASVSEMVDLHPIGDRLSLGDGPRDQPLVCGSAPAVSAASMDTIAIEHAALPAILTPAPDVAIGEAVDAVDPRSLNRLTPAGEDALVQVQPHRYIQIRRQMVEREIVGIVPAPWHDVACGDGDASPREDADSVIGAAGVRDDPRIGI